MPRVTKKLDSNKPIVPTKSESAEAGKVYDFLMKPEIVGTTVLHSETGEEVPLPDSIYRVLKETALEVSKGHAVSVMAAQQELTTTQAADVLNVSRPYLIRLIDEGQIPSRKVGSHRRVCLDDVLRYKHERDAARREMLKRLTQESQDMGLDY